MLAVDTMPLYDAHEETILFHFFMWDMFPAKPAILFDFQAIRIIFFILHR